VDIWEFLTSWYFMGLMGVLLSCFVLLIPIGIILAILHANRVARENRERDRR
jgi:hypothetical protein